MSLSKWLLSCPILLTYIEELDELSKFNSFNLDSELIVAQALKKIPIRSHWANRDIKINKTKPIFSKATYDEAKQIDFVRLFNVIDKREELKSILEEVYKTPISGKSLNTFIDKINTGELKW